MAKFVIAQEAVQSIHSGDRVALAHSVGEPQALVNAMLENYQAYENVEICHMLALGPCKYTRPEMAGHFWHNSLFAGPGSRKAVNEGRADYTPNLFGESPRLFYDKWLSSPSPRLMTEATAPMALRWTIPSASPNAPSW